MSPSSDVRIVPLGGLGEVGMNCLAFVHAGRAMVVDCGVTFDEAELGVDVVHADFAFLDEVPLAGVVVTHGHEDHIGAIPYLLKRFDVPVYGPPYALALVREKLKEHEVLGHARLVEVGTREPYRVGPFEIEHFRVTHSIADATAIAIRTARGTIVHTGDFKFDEDPPDGERFDEEGLRAVGDAGVELLLSDSTNAETEGVSGSESIVGAALEKVVHETEGAVVVGLFASNAHRLRLLGEIARRTHRRIVLLGRSMRTHTRVARDAGYLDWGPEATFPVERLRELPRRSVLALATGTQGEEMAALGKLSRGDVPGFALESGDAVVFSSRVIPGHEPEVYALKSALLRRGVALHTHRTARDLHVSGHAYRDEQRRMIELVRPRAFIPLHGTRVQLDRHRALAVAAGVGHTELLENGETAFLGEGGLRRGERVRAGRVRVFAHAEVTEATVADRKALASSGVVAVTVLVDERGALARPPVVVARGVVDPGHPGFLRDVGREIEVALAALGPPLTDERIAETTRLAARRVASKVMGRRPVVLATVLRG